MSSLKSVRLTSSEVWSRTCFSSTSVSEPLPQRSGAVSVAGQPRGRLRQRHEARARLLRQALEQRLDLVLEHARHQPLGALVAHLVQHVQRHRHREAVARIARLVQVGGGAIDAAQADVLGKASVVMPAASCRISSSRVSFSRSGFLRLSVRYQPSKVCR
jgi:hypothetical protein